MILPLLLLALSAQELEVRQNIEIWRGSERLLRGPVERPVPGTRDVDKLADFERPRLSADGKTLYFLASLGVEQQALCRYSIGAPKAEYLVPAVDFALIDEGKLSGQVLLVQRAYAKAGRGKPLRPTFATYLLTPDGKLGKRVGGEGESLAAVLARLRSTR